MIEISPSDLLPRRSEAHRESPYCLNDLLARVTPENLHPEVDSGPSIGEEAP